MRRILLALAALAASAALSGPAAALTGNDLPTPEERTRYEQLLATNKTEAGNYLITRDYVRRAKEIVDSGGEGARQFPGKPKGFSSQYLSLGDKDKINEAVKLSIEALAESRYA